MCTHTPKSGCVLRGVKLVRIMREWWDNEEITQGHSSSLSPFCFYSQVFLPKTISQTWYTQGRPDWCASVHRSQSLSMRRSTDLRNSINASSWWVLQDWHGNQQCNRPSCNLTSPHPTEKLTTAQWNCLKREQSVFWQPVADTYGSTKNQNTQQHPTKVFLKNQNPTLVTSQADA